MKKIGTFKIHELDDFIRSLDDSAKLRIAWKWAGGSAVVYSWPDRESLLDRIHRDNTKNDYSLKYFTKKTVWMHAN